MTKVKWGLQREQPQQKDEQRHNDDVAVEEESQAHWVRKQLACHRMRFRHRLSRRRVEVWLDVLEVPRILTHLIDVGKLLATLSHLLASSRSARV
jgi:hypothetical protein